MNTAGDYVGEEVWFRIVQIVTNTEPLQAYAARRVYEYLRQPACHENIVKVAAYILGEYGHLIASENDNNAVSPIEQFSSISSKVSMSSSTTKAIILTTYIKWLNLFPEIRQHILVILQKFTHTLDAELQQRACEYLAIAEFDGEDDLLQTVVDEMPPFPEHRESTLMNSLLKKKPDASGPRIRSSSTSNTQTNGISANDPHHASRRKALPADGQSTADNARGMASAAAVQIDGINGHGNQVQLNYGDDIMANLAGLDLGNPIASVAANDIVTDISHQAVGVPATQTELQAQAPLLVVAENGNRDRSSSSVSVNLAPAPTPGLESMSTPIEDASAVPAVLSDVRFTHGIERWLDRLPYNPEGVLYEDAQIQIGVKSEYTMSQGRITLFFGNKIAMPFTSFTVLVDSREPDALAVTMPKTISSTLSAATQSQQVIQLECRKVFTTTPVLRVSYLAGSLQSLTLQLPVWANKFFEPVTLDGPAFFERWGRIGGPPREAQAIFSARLTSAGIIDFARHRKVIKGLKINVLDGIDPNPNNIVAAGILHMQTGKVGCLMRLEPNANAKVRQ